MKLITQTNKNFIIIILIVLPVSCFLLFFSLNYFISDEVDEKLRVDELRIINQLKANPSFISIAPVIEVSEIDKEIKINTDIINVLIYDPIEKEEEPFRELTSVKKIGEKWYLIKVRHSTIEDKDFFIAIGGTMALMLLLIFGLLLFLNNRLSLQLWSPFYHNIDKLKTYSFKESKELELLDSKIDEFQDLKNSLIILTDKLQQDYKSLKEFTENASHEIQTPLSIISMNLDEVLQEEHSENNYRKLYSCYQSTQRLSKLNEKLLLLAKLDNDQFNDLKEVSFNEMLFEKVEELRPLIKEKELEIIIVNNGSFILKIDSFLANLLLINLISNAIKHSIPKSLVEIELSAKSMTFSNKTNLEINKNLIFKRFKKGNDASNSTGLGLSIVKSIADVSNLNIEVLHEDHVFKISIKKV
jgi:hypothetical protein